MKILNITFKNINNLKGEHQVNFEAEPLSQAGIFAIVGPTGSGKSTLLDVITLALFNQIPRFKRAISKSEIGSLGSVVTHHAEDASASITYRIKDQKYTSTWTISKTRTGNLKDYQMFLYDSSGTPLDLKRSEVPAKNEEIIGLKYDQFIKSIILSQGEFAKFLKADKNERGQLLENITGTSIYRSLGKACFQKQKELKDKLDKEKEIKGVVQVLTDDERTTFAKEQEKLTKDKLEIDEKLKNSNKLRQIKEAIIKSSNALSEKKIASTEVIKKLTEFAPMVAKLATHDGISPLRGDIAEFDIATDNAKRSAKNLEDYTASYKTADESLKEAITEMSELTKEKVTKDSFMTVMSKFERAVNDLDKDLSHLKDRGTEERKLINQQKENYIVVIEDTASPSSAIELLTNHATELKESITASKITITSKPDKVKKEIAQLREQCTLLRDLHHNFEHIAEENKKIKSEEKNIEKAQQVQKKNKPLLQRDEELQHALTQKLELLIKRKEDQIKIAKLEDLRDKLITGEACPLCGATDHPYTKHLDEIKSSELEKEIAKAKKEIDTKKTESDKVKELLTNAETIINISTKRITEIKSNLEEGKKASAKMIKQYTGKEKLTQNNIEEIYNTQSTKLENTEKAIQSLEALKLNQELTKAYERLQAIGISFKQKKDQRQALFEGKEVNEITDKLQNKFADANGKLTENKTAISKETKDLAGANKMLTSLESKLLPKSKKLGFSSIAELTSNILSEEEAKQIREDQQSLKQFEVATKTEISVLEKQIKESKEQDDKPKVSLDVLLASITKEEESQAELSTAISEIKSKLKRDEEDKQKLKSREKEIETLTSDLERWSLLNNLIGDATGNKFANFSQGLTLQNLLVYTNKRLSHLSDRYLINKPDGDGTLKVIDQYQGNIERSVSTLSGGETFLISLALALSLSDMASKNVRLECLFIDEGFGTLDQETLETAMMTLEKLQSESQKTVGVISHVEALKERIKVQIQLEKNPQGYSKIRIKA